MSRRVLVIPEDATHDHYILQPLIQSMLASIGSPNAVVRVLIDPAVQGVQQALNDEFLRHVIDKYPMVDLFLLCVDRDGDAGREDSVRDRESRAREYLGDATRAFIGTCAYQEVEVWCLAGMADLPKGWKWSDVRSEPDSKERYFGPYVKMRRLSHSPGEGREVLGREAAKRYGSIRSRCDEIRAIEVRLQT